MSKNTEPEKGKQPGRVKHDRGLADFLALGADRSLGKLYRQYTKIMLKPPALVTLKSWSVRYAWQATAAQYDARVASQVAEKAETAAVDQGVDHVQALHDVADKALRKVVDGLDAESIKADDAYQMAALVNSALGAIRGVQLLTGKATERFGAEVVKDHAPEWMADKLTAPASPPTPPTASDQTQVPADATRH